MLLRLITIISLIKFMLLLISGTSLEIALYRSLIVFLILFTVLYLTIYLLNVIRDSDTSSRSSTVPDVNGTGSDKEE
ncbi:MAG: hypothetical protein WD355_02540 [Balneolaceae bacterium]